MEFGMKTLKAEYYSSGFGIRIFFQRPLGCSPGGTPAAIDLRKPGHPPEWLGRLEGYT